MLTCADCTAEDCANVGVDTNACDNFTGGGVGASAPAPSPMSEEGRKYMEERLEAMYDKLLVRMAILEGRWDRMIAAMVKAANEEDG